MPNFRVRGSGVGALDSGRRDQAIGSGPDKMALFCEKRSASNEPRVGCVPMRGSHMLNFDGMVRLMVPTAKRR